jgi:ATP-dependent DNA helicase RecG
MLRAELQELIRNGESSGVEFKLDTVENYKLAKEIVAFANLQGGVVLLGVADNGSVEGTTRGDKLEEWVMELCRVKIDPPIIPYFEVHPEFEPGKQIAVLRVLQGPSKPYARVHEQHRTYYIRVGTTSREASAEELQRMFQEAGSLRYGLKPVPGAVLEDLDLRRLKDYFGRVLEQDYPLDEDRTAWETLLKNLELMVSAEDRAVPTVDGMLLFGKNPKRFLPQSGIRAIAFPGNQRDYAARSDQELIGPLVALYSAAGSPPEQVLVENGLVEQALDFVARNTQPEARIENGVRVDRPAYPAEVLREVIVNALVHRDYTIVGTDISLTIFDNRLEVASPGRLPNTATVDALKTGFRYARNQTLVNVMRDYRYVDFRGMGIRDKIIPGMRAHSGKEPVFAESGHSFVVTLLK